MGQLKLYLNENLSWRIAKALREYGYDVVSSEEVAMNETDDQTQLAFAVSERRAIVTNNVRDFVELDEQYATENKPHCGIFFTTKCSFTLLLKRLKNVLERMKPEESDIKIYLNFSCQDAQTRSPSIGILHDLCHAENPDRVSNPVRVDTTHIGCLCGY